MNWLDLVIVIVAILGLLNGIRNGIIKQSISLIALLLAILFSGGVVGVFRFSLENFDLFANSLSVYEMDIVSYVLTFLVLFLIFKLLGKMVEKAIKFTPIIFVDKILGGLFGIILFIVVLSLCFNILTFLDNKSKVISKETKEKSLFYYGVEGIIPSISPFVRDGYLKIKEDISKEIKEVN